MLKEKLQEDLKNALIEKKESELSVLRMLGAAITNKEKEKRFKISKAKPEATENDLAKESRLNDKEVINQISSEIKKRKEAISLFAKGGRQDLAAKEKKETEILQKYLPEQLSEEEIRKLVKEAIDKTGAKEQKEMGKVMAELMSKIKGKADNTLVSKIVKELLSLQ